MRRLGTLDNDGGGGDEEQPQGDQRESGARGDAEPVAPVL